MLKDFTEGALFYLLTVGVVFVIILVTGLVTFGIFWAFYSLSGSCIVGGIVLGIWLVAIVGGLATVLEKRGKKNHEQ